MKSLSRAQRILGSGVLASLSVIHCGRAATNDSPLTLDPAFSAGLAKLKQATGFIEDQPNQSPTDWKPNLQLLVGVKAVEGSKRTIYFVQLTTLPPPTNSLGQPWQPTLRTNNWAWSPSNQTQFVTALYPVRARVFDETGRQFKAGQTPMAWGMLTNGLLDMCQLSLEIIPRESATNQMPRGLPDEDNDRLMCALGGGFMWMAGMFGDFQTVPPVADVWKKAQCAIRMPSAWSMIKGIFTGFSINLQPRLNEVTLNTPDDGSMPLYRLPLDLKSRKETLTDVEIIIGRARGAEMLMSGIRSIRAVHPSKADREFLAQVLATGSCPEE